MKRVLKLFDYFFIGFSFLASKKLIAILTICLFISLIQVSTGYREELLLKEQEMMYEKGNPSIRYYQDESIQVNYGDGSAISDLITCYQRNLAEGEIPEPVLGYIQTLNEIYDQDNSYFSFLYQDLFSGFTVSYNEDTPIFTASTIKAPAMIYLYEMASLGKVDLSEKLVYTSNYYSGGSGVLKTKPTGTSYTINELIEYAIHDSDNIAYRMLMERFSREAVLNFWKELGTEYIFTLDTIWGVTSAKDASIYMKELYRFSKENKEYGSKLMEYFKNAEWKLITNQNGEFITANKGGWSGTAIHDVAIVFEENPYILIIMSNTGEGNYSDLFHSTSELVGKLHEEYWKYKVNVCGKILQY